MKTSVGPVLASSTPAIAGPMKRATWSSSELIATALSRSSRGTVDARIACVAGNDSAPSDPPTRASSAIQPTVSVSVAYMTASAAATSRFSAWNPSSSLRGSYLSASAPAGSPQIRLGIVLRKPIRPSVAADPPSSRTT